MTEIEIWKDVIGYAGAYEVSDKGRVRSLDRLDSIGRKLKGRPLKSDPNPGGYLKITLHNGNRKTRMIHQLVCESFIGPRPESKEVCHGRKGKLDNSISNLRYGTRSENQQDRFRDGTSRNIAVICGDGREFISSAEAMRLTGVDGGSISKCCRGLKKDAGGLTWSYANGAF